MDIQKIIDALNTQGRQGPQDLLSDECYQWVSSIMKIPRSQYESLIEQNTVDHSLRPSHRRALFIRKNGKVSLFKSSEEELRPFVCLAVMRMDPPVTSARLIPAVKQIYPHMTAADMMLQHNLSAPQCRIDQTIRNILVSNYSRQANRRLFFRSGSTPYTYSLTADGQMLAQKALKDTVDIRASLSEPEPGVLPAQARPWSQEELTGAHLRPIKYPSPSSGRRPATDPRLLAAVLSLSGYLCAVDRGHAAFKSMATGHPYVEGHHIIPLEAQPLFPEINLDCPENIVPLCPNCHKALHYGVPAERRVRLEAILAKHRAGLAAIGIDDDTLKAIIWRFYLCDDK